MDRPLVLRLTKPKRCLNSYNFFFGLERQRLLDELPDNPNNTTRNGHGKISFKELALTVAKSWKVASDEYKAHCMELSRIDRIRFAVELEEYNATQKYLRHKGRHGPCQFIEVFDTSIPSEGTSARFCLSFRSLEPKPIGASATFTPSASSAVESTVRIPILWNTMLEGEDSLGLATSSSYHSQILNKDDGVPPVGNKNYVTPSDGNTGGETSTQNVVSPNERMMLHYIPGSAFP